MLQQSTKQYLRQFNLRILVVEDNDVNRIVAVNLLEKLGCKVITAINGVEALRILATDAFDIIFMDIQMPELDGFETTRAIRSQEREQRQAGIAVKPANIIAMTASTMLGDNEKCFAVGMNYYLAKPINFDKISEILTDYTEGKIKQNQANILHHDSLSPSEDHTMQKSILLVEDNSVNAMVACRFLEALNCRVAVAEDGAQAVSSCKATQYDMILMDIRMPVMDGVQATILIREMEAKSKRRTPIIALTANTMPQDLRRYTASGIDECIPKPVKIETLQSVLKRFLNYTPTVQYSKAEAEHNKNQDLAIFSSEQAKRISMGNLAILQRIIDKYREDTPKQISKLQQTIHENDLDPAERIAHSIKGSSRSVGAMRIGNLALNIEQAIKREDMDAVETYLMQLPAEFALLIKELDHINWQTLLD